MIRYEVDVHGVEPPHTWKVFKSGVGYGRSKVAEGESDTFDGAVFDAAEAARDAEVERRAKTKTATIELFSVDESGDRRKIGDDVPVAEPPADGPSELLQEWAQ